MSTKPKADLSPPMRDSDVVFLCVKRLEVIAAKMQRREYDDDLERLMAEVAEWLTWLDKAIINRETDGDA